MNEKTNIYYLIESNGTKILLLLIYFKEVNLEMVCVLNPLPSMCWNEEK